MRSLDTIEFRFQEKSVGSVDPALDAVNMVADHHGHQYHALQQILKASEVARKMIETQRDNENEQHSDETRQQQVGRAENVRVSKQGRGSVPSH